MKYVKKSLNISFVILTLISTFFIRMPFSSAKSFKAKVTGNAVALRDKPTTKNSNRLDTLNSGDIIDVLDDTKIYDKDNKDCTAGWVKIKYDGQEGYFCSEFYTADLSDQYLRPWNTPKKAIVGGALYIAKGYISKGQYTSYLKKYNVNPSGSYAVYTHLYQANISAPKSEAYTSFLAYYKNNAMDLPFNFSIPVFENIGETNYNPATGTTDANLDRIDTVKDAEFEKKLVDFPDSYKPYLRALHDEHPSWSFTAMKTNLDFTTAATNFRLTGAINSTNTKLTELDANGKPVPTNEKNWYYPNLGAVKYYMDPRNWLNETFVFMFENLSYIQVEDKIVKSVLSRNAAIAEFDAIDNQSFVSIYQEAGKTANVNPVYLASLSVQEINSSNTSGNKFTYEGVEYEGLFNYYNIGAYSSASNPLRAGLVWASGGLCTQCASYTPSSNPVEPTPTPTPAPEPVGDVKNIGAKVNGSYVSGIALGTTASSIQSKDTNLTYSTTGVIGTGSTIKYKDGTTFTVVIYGDLSGDGQVNSADLLKLRQHLLGTNKLGGAYLEAAKVTGNDNINSANLLKIRQFLLGTTNISQG